MADWDSAPVVQQDSRRSAPMRSNIAPGTFQTPIEALTGNGPTGNPILTSISRAARGDPRVEGAMKNIYASESGHKPQWDLGDHGYSGGPYQMDTQKPDFLGSQFQASNPGMSVHDPKTLDAQSDYVADYIRKNPNQDLSNIWHGLKNPDRFGRDKGGYPTTSTASYGDVPSPPPAPDYDYEGFKASGKAQAANGHYPDTFKLPNHMTFSSDSKYSKPGQEGGKWSKDETGKWHFAPTPFNLKQHSVEELQAYFKKVEPDSILDLPSWQSAPAADTWQSAPATDTWHTAPAAGKTGLENDIESGWSRLVQMPGGILKDIKDTASEIGQGYMQGQAGAHTLAAKPLYGIGGALKAAANSPIAQDINEAAFGTMGVEGAPGGAAMRAAENAPLPKIAEAPKAAAAAEKSFPEFKPLKAPEQLEMFPAGADVPKKRTVTVPASEKEGARGLIQQQYGLATGDTSRQAVQVEKDIAAPETRATPEQQLKLRQYVETPMPELRSQLPKDLQKAADIHKELMQDFRKQMEGLDPTGKQHFFDDYLSHMYGNQERFSAWSATQPRSIPTYEEAERLGLEPKYKTVADIDNAYIRAMNRWNASRRVENALKEQGLVIPGTEMGTKEIPKDWQVINTGRFKMQPAFAPAKIAEDYNRFYSPPIQGKAGEFVTKASEAMHDMRSLAFAGGPQYHAINETVESIGQGFGRAMGNVMSGNLGRAAKSLTQANPISPILRGRKGLEVYLRPAEMSRYEEEFRRDLSQIAGAHPDDAQLIAELEQAHAVPNREFVDLTLDETSLAKYLKRRGGGLASGVASYAKEGLQRLDKEGMEIIGKNPFKIPQAAVRTVFKGLSRSLMQVSEPLFGYAIPRLKLGSSMQMLEDWHAANPNATREEAIAAARKIGKSADNVFGEMNRDNLFMRRGVLQALDLAMLAPSWNIGSARLLVGGVKGTTQAAAEAAINLFMKDKLQYAPSFSMASKNWDPTMQAFYGSIFSGLMFGGAMTWFLSGTRPRELMDFISARTGGKTKETDAKGHTKLVDTRLKTMGNLGWDLSTAKGIAGIMPTQGWVPEAADPLGELRNKLNPAVGTAYDLATNRNFKGHPIYGGKDLSNVPGQVGRYVNEELTPFALQPKSALKAEDQTKVPRWLGVPEAGMAQENAAGYAALMRKMRGKPEEQRKKKITNPYSVK